MAQSGPPHREQGRLDDRLDTMKRELDALQIHVMKEKAPWWKQVPIIVPLLISLGALAFSFWSFQRGEARLDRQEEHDARAELRDLVVRLQALPTQALELNRKFANDPGARANASALINTETRILAHQAADLILVELNGDASAPEYYSVIDGLFRAGEPSADLEALVAQGLRVADEPQSAAVLYRYRAKIRFRVGNLESGRTAYNEALNVFEKFPDVDVAPTWVNVIQAQTQSNWAEDEASQKSCENAWRHLRLAKRIGGFDTHSSTEYVKAWCGSGNNSKA
jgi:tetratricopeptide (TPR) repeat protein